jgi:acyl-CoA hydrolase
LERSNEQSQTQRESELGIPRSRCGLPTILFGSTTLSNSSALMKPPLKVVDYVSTNFSQAPRVLTEHIGIDTFLVTVSPMDRQGYFTFGTGNDYSSKVARAARHLIVEVNENMPRVYGSLAALHVSEVEAIVENHVPLLELPARKTGPEDAAIGKMIAEMVPDGACLQMENVKLLF